MKSKNYWVPILFIVSGIILLGRNMGFVDETVFRLLFSWQALLIVIGFIQFFYRSYVRAFILMFIGFVFMLPRLGWVEHSDLRVFWPVVLIFIGLMLFFQRRSGNSHHKKGTISGNEVVSDGFVSSKNLFSGVRTIVLDPVFRGAELKNLFGGMEIDLRRTKLEDKEVFIDVDCLFGGISLYVPDSWNVQLRVNTIFGSCDDERPHFSAETDSDHVLIIRGTASFSGVEIKS